MLFGIVTTFVLFALNIVITTIGELIVIPSTIGPGAAGYILDPYNPNLLWYIGGALCGLSALAYYFLPLRLGARKEFAPAQDEALPFPATTD